MIEPSDHRTKLLADAVHGDWAEGPVADFARQAAAHARGRRRLRYSLQAVGATACLLAFVSAIFSHQPEPSRFSAKSQGHKTPAYEIISDDALLAELHDRPLLAVKNENGMREFVLLDR